MATQGISKETADQLRRTLKIRDALKVLADERATYFVVWANPDEISDTNLDTPAHALAMIEYMAKAGAALKAAPKHIAVVKPKKV